MNKIAREIIVTDDNVDDLKLVTLAKQIKVAFVLSFTFYCFSAMKGISKFQNRLLASYNKLPSNNVIR